MQKQSANEGHNLITQERYVQLMNLLQQNQPFVFSVQSSVETYKDLERPSFSDMFSCLSVYSNKPKHATEIP